jgi:prepilin-type N-terminal cleavage/methylation domain-containing protein
MKRNKSISAMSRAFTLIEMIGVLAIIGILASVVSPRVIEAIRDAKVTGVIANLNAARTAASTYYGRYNNYPVDGTKAAIQQGTTNLWERTYGDAAVVASNAATFGDILCAEGLLENIKSPLGATGTNGSGMATTAVLAHLTNTTVNGTNGFAFIACRTITNGANTTGNFTGAANATRTVYFVIPGVSMQEAASLKIKIDGPFANDAYSGGASGLTSLAVNPTANTPPLIENGNCRLTVATGTAGGAGSTYNVFLYVAND